MSVVVEWSRIEPESGVFDEAALTHYAHVIQAIRDRNIEPVLILQQVTLPEWFARKGGWSRQDAAEKFGAYTNAVANKLADQVRWWIPIAEPEHWITRAFFDKQWPSEAGGSFRARHARHHIAKAHAEAYAKIHSLRDDAMVGPSIRLRHLVPHNPYSAWDARAAVRESRRCNRAYLHQVRNAADFIGASYDGQDRIQFRLTRPAASFAETVTDEGKPTRGETYVSHPEGLDALLDDLRQHDRPILITGNGMAGGDDAAQCEYLLDHASVIRHALDRGIPVAGYVYRALLDGMEWTEGRAHHRALVHVDFDKLTRTPNTVAYLYKELCETGAIRPGTVAQFCPDWTLPVREESQP